MGEITGRHVLAVTSGAFGVIIAVNLLMAYKAISTFPGLEVQNGYIASQTFEAEKQAQRALGWVLEPAYRAGHLTLDFRDAAGLPAPVTKLSVLIGRTTEAKDDQTPAFRREGGQFIADVSLPRGKWMLKVEAAAPDGTLFRQRIDLMVRD